MQVFGVGCRCYGCTDHWHLSAFLLLHGPGFVGVDYDVGADEGVDVGTSVSTKVLVSDKVLTDVDNGRVGGGKRF